MKDREWNVQSAVRMTLTSTATAGREFDAARGVHAGSRAGDAHIDDDERSREHAALRGTNIGAELVRLLAEQQRQHAGDGLRAAADQKRNAELAAMRCGAVLQGTAQAAAACQQRPRSTARQQGTGSTAARLQSLWRYIIATDLGISEARFNPRHLPVGVVQEVDAEEDGEGVGLLPRRRLRHRRATNESESGGSGGWTPRTISL